jgi:hypothetical protein
MKLPNFKIAGVIASLLLPMGASAAVTYIEVPDAGQTLATAQSVPGGVSVITGNVAAGSADLFKFNWGGGAFYVNTVGTLAFDSQLFLFNSSGGGVWGNDDGIAFAGPAYISDPALPAGEYYLGISGYNFDPVSAAGLIFQSSPFEPVYGPLNNSPLSGWTGGSGGGDYTISFQRITSDGTPDGDPTPVGVPDGGMTLVLLGMAMSGVAWARRKVK